MSKYINRYQKWVHRMVGIQGEVSALSPTAQSASYAALGVGGESGEMIDHLKKYLLHGKELNRDAYLDECGDLLHYFMEGLTVVDATIEEVAERNITKLQARYPGRAEFK